MIKYIDVIPDYTLIAQYIFYNEGMFSYIENVL